MIELIGNVVEGVLSVTPKGFGFVMTEQLDEDIFVEAFNIKDALHKDTVKVKILSVEDNGRLKGKIVGVVKRGVSSVVGTYVKARTGAQVIADDQRFNVVIKIDKEDSLDAQFDDKVKVTIKDYIEHGVVSAIVTDVLGNKDLPGVDILSMCLKHGIEADFNPVTLEEAAQIPAVVEKKDLIGRKDLRHEDIFTIDGADAKDLDDAIGIKRLTSGRIELTVAIADVTHYIKEGTALDQEAFSRGTSVYLTDRVVPMIPKSLSNGICSLNPRVDRLTIACTMEIDENGHVQKHDIYPAVINTKHRMTYTDVTAILEGDEELRDIYSDSVESFELMLELRHILKRKRILRGSIEFDVKEAKVLVDDTGFPTEIIYRERGVSEEIIEEFMLLANETVAERFERLKYPFIYRVHEQPSPDKLNQLYRTTRLFGYTLKGDKEATTPKALQAMLEIVKGKKEASMINKTMLRAMQKARYAETNLGHFGLAATYYTHFTSPIRRYPDLIVHRMIRTFLFEKRTDQHTIDHFNDIMPGIGVHTSEKERGAVDCERDVTSMKMAEYMTQFIGEKFDGVISSVTKWGLYVELPNTIEGLIRLSDMKDDFYEFNEDMLIVVGRRKRYTYRIGDEIKVKVKAASKEEGTIDFLVSGKPQRKPEDEKKYVGNKKKPQGKQHYRNKSKNKRKKSKR